MDGINLGTDLRSYWQSLCVPPKCGRSLPGWHAVGSPVRKTGPRLDSVFQVVRAGVERGELFAAGEMRQVIYRRRVWSGWKRRRSAGARTELGQRSEELGRTTLLLPAL